MKNFPELPEDRLHDLLADRALDGLPDAEMAELRELLDDAPEVSPDELDATAASLAVALAADDREPLPDHLRDRIEVAANRFARGPGDRSSVGWKLAAASGWVSPRRPPGWSGP